MAGCTTEGGKYWRGGGGGEKTICRGVSGAESMFSWGRSFLEEDGTAGVVGEGAMVVGGEEG